MPASKVRLFSPQQYFQQEDGGTFYMNRDRSIFTFKGGGTLTFKYDNSSLPKTIDSISKLEKVMAYLASTGKKNISKAKRELLMWHASFGHYNIGNT